MQYTTFLEKISQLCDDLDAEGETSDTLLADVWQEAEKRLKVERDKAKTKVRQPRKRPRGVNNG